MLRLAARYGDAWNWWAGDETLEQSTTRLRPLIDRLDLACEAEERDLATLGRTLDLYTVVPETFRTSAQPPEAPPMQQPVTGTNEEIAEYLHRFGELGFDEIRCDVWPKTTDAIEAMQPVVEAVHAA